MGNSRTYKKDILSVKKIVFILQHKDTKKNIKVYEISIQLIYEKENHLHIQD